MNHEEFNKRIEGRVRSIESNIENFDPLYLISLINQIELHSTNPSVHISYLPDGFVQKFHYINGLVVSKDLPNENCNASGNLDQLLLLIEDLFNDYTISWITRPSLDGSNDAKKVKEYGAGLALFLSCLHQPKLGSTEQFIQSILDKFSKFDNDVFIPIIGISVQQCVDITSKIADIILNKYNNYVNIYSKIKSEYSSLEKQFFNYKSLFISCFTISKVDLANHFPKSSIDAFFNAFSFKSGCVNVDFRYPTDINELDAKFLMQLDDGDYYALEAIRLFQILSEGLLQVILKGRYKERYFKHRDQIAQKKTAELLGTVFPTFFEKAFYGNDIPMEFETDMLIPFEKTLLICEIKATNLRNPLYTVGNINKIKSDFSDSIQQAYSQSLRTREYILSRSEALFVNKHGDLLCSLKRNDFNDIILMIVTAESFRSVATYLSLLLDKKQNDPYPISISLFDLELLVTKLNNPKIFIEYVAQRSKIHDSVYSDDELDFAGYFLKYGNLDFSEQLERGDMIVLDGSFSNVFDEDWYEAHGFEIQKNDLVTAEKNKPCFSTIGNLGDQIALNEDSEYIITDKNKQVKLKKSAAKMKGRDRNKPCPCGSGKKYKKCCG